MSQGAASAQTAATDKSAPARPSQEQILDQAFWKTFAPKLNIGTPSNLYAFDVNDSQKKDYNERILREGYIHLAQPGLNSDLETMRNLFDKIVSNGLPPVFSFVYDEVWTLIAQTRNLLKSVMHEEFLLMPDFWAWRVAPGQSGWAPHRDKLEGSLFPDRRPKSLTVWVPITKAYPLNSCMYVYPADRDELYGIDNAEGFSASPPDIRALPGEPGDVFVWTQHLLHWGSRSALKHDLGPRMSIAFECQRGDIPAFNSPLLNPEKIPSFEQRLALISKQIMQYRHMYGFDAGLVSIAEEIAKRHKMPDQE